MVKYIVVARVHDGLPLAATIDDDDLNYEFPDHKSHSKRILKEQVPKQTEPRVTIDCDNYNFHVYVKDGIAFVALTDRLYPKRLAYGCLEEVSEAFLGEYQSEQVNRVNRPFELIRFTNSLQKIKRSFQDVRAKQNIEKLQSEFADISNIMHSNIDTLLQRGNKLENMSMLSTTLTQDARKYVRNAQQLNWNAFLERYAIPGVILVFFILCLIVYFRYLK